MANSDKEGHERKFSAENLIKRLRVSSDNSNAFAEILSVTCKDESECGQVWRRFITLRPIGWTLVLYYGDKKEHYGTKRF